MANIYEKIQLVKKIIKDENIQKSGAVSFPGTKFDYFELQDFLPMVIDLFEQFKLYSKISLDNDYATLTIINIENPEEREVYTSPMPKETASINKNAMQAIGGIHTYSRRYLYMAALDIIQQDAIEPMTRQTNSAEQTGNNDISNMTDTKPTEKQMKRLYAIRKSAGINDNETYKRLLEKHYNKSTDKELNITEYNDFISKLESIINRGQNIQTQAELNKLNPYSDEPFDAKEFLND